MFEIGNYYKHLSGRDAIMEPVEVTEVEGGWQIKALWRVLDYHGNVYGPVTNDYDRPHVYEHTITHEQAQFWRLYEA